MFWPVSLRFPVLLQISISSQILFYSMKRTKVISNTLFTRTVNSSSCMLNSVFQSFKHNWFFNIFTLFSSIRRDTVLLIRRTDFKIFVPFIRIWLHYPNYSNCGWNYLSFSNCVQFFTFSYKWWYVVWSNDCMKHSQFRN